MNPTIESTYRLQLHAGFGFRDAAAVVPYLNELGITHVYASPYLKARPGSTHGYDVIDHSKLNPELGTQEDFGAFLDALGEHGMAHILDIVPNHVGVGTNDNACWNDVLENGPASRFAACFDITWRGSPRPELHDKVLLPLLGETYGDVLEKGQLRLAFENGTFGAYYFERRFPISPRTYGRILGRNVEPLIRDDPNTLEYHSILTAVRHLPDRSARDEAEIQERRRETEVIKRRLAALAEASESVRKLIEANVAEFNRDVELLDDLLDHQCYRLSYWHVASDEINYRRFFDINDLAALSVEREEVFAATHQLVLGLIRDGKLAGVRVDHPDGLYDPKQYFQRLRDSGVNYVVAEKILAMDEKLPPDWPVNGTSGYDALNMINGIFVDGRNEQAFTRLYQEWTGDDTPYETLVYRNKLAILDMSLASELQMLAYQLDRIAQQGRRSRDFTHNALRHALRETIACFPVYRSYISPQGAGETDRKHIDSAIERAKTLNPRTEPAVFDFLRHVLLTERNFAGKFQQVTAPVTAKGIEDTTFYVYNRLASLNEVGGAPQRFGVTPEQLHAYLQDRQKNWPLALTCLSTHDTKRSEDVRARINVLTEIPDDWRRAVTRWADINRHDGPPYRNEEYLLYQTLAGAWNDGDETLTERISAYMLKAAREAKVHTSWTSPDAAYENALGGFVSRVLTSRAFLDDFILFARRIAQLGEINSLAQTLLRLTVPGVADTYQGTELLDFSLVDPDNRRPVDFTGRRELLRRPERDRKLLVTTRALHARREHPGLFSRGRYIPLEVTGARREHVFAFARELDGMRGVVAVPRLVATIGGWGDTSISIASGTYRNVLAARRQPFSGAVAELFRDFPVALLISEA